MSEILKIKFYKKYLIKFASIDSLCSNANIARYWDLLIWNFSVYFINF